MVVQFPIVEYSASKVLAVEFSTHLKCHAFINNQPFSDQPIVNIANNIFQITEKTTEIILQETKGLIKIPSGVYTRLEIETAKMLFHAKEIPVDFRSPLQVTKAYQNFMDNLIEHVPDFTSEDNSNQGLESFLVVLSIPFLPDEAENHQIADLHLQQLKELGFTHIALLDHLSSSLFSQWQKNSESESSSNHMSILVNIAKSTQIGIMDDNLFTKGFVNLELGTTAVLEHSKAILRDLNIRGIKDSTLVQWLLSEGRSDSKAPLTKKTIRRKDVNITPILNSPKILFDYQAVTGKKQEANSIILDGVVKSLKILPSEIQQKLDTLLKNIIVIGPGALFKGIDVTITKELQVIFPQLDIHTIIGQDPLNCIINGLSAYIQENSMLLAYVVEDTIIPQELKATYGSELQEALLLLRSLKAHIHNLPELKLVAEKFLQKVESLPSAIQSLMNINITSESKYWSIDFNNYLNPMIKKAEQSLAVTEEIANEFKKIGYAITELPMFIKPALTKVFTSYVYGLKYLKLQFEGALDNRE